MVRSKLLAIALLPIDTEVQECDATAARSMYHSRVHTIYQIFSLTNLRHQSYSC